MYSLNHVDTLPPQRITVAEIIEDQWFQIDYKPAVGIEFEEKGNIDDAQAGLDSVQVTVSQPQYKSKPRSPPVWRDIPLSLPPTPFKSYPPFPLYINSTVI